MNNFLELCQRVRQDAGIPGTGPSTVRNQTGELKKIVDWTREAWTEIQAWRTEWNFMWASVTPIWKAGYSSRTPEDLNLPDLQRYDRTLTVIEAADANKRREIKLTPWSLFHDDVGSRTLQAGGLTMLSSDPQRRLRASTIADQDYVLDLRYYRRPQILENDADIPYLRKEFRALIMYLALRKYAANDEASNLYVDAQNNVSTWRTIVENNELPEIVDASYSLDRYGD